MKVIFDNNIWISFAIGKHLNDIPDILKRTEIEIFACDELFSEFERAVRYPKLAKILNPARVVETLELMTTKALRAQISRRVADFTDAKDNYLLDLCDAIQANFLITGDKPLLRLEHYNQTRIITYREFCEMLGI